MSFQQKNVTVSLVNFSLILGFYSIRVFQMIQSGSFNSENVFRLWWIIIGLAIGVTIFATILTHIVLAILNAIRTGNENPDVESVEDERDQSIDLRGTKFSYLVDSIGGFVSMMTFVQGQPPLVMFSLLIFFGVLAQILGDVLRLRLYQKGL